MRPPHRTGGICHNYHVNGGGLVIAVLVSPYLGVNSKLPLTTSMGGDGSVLCLDQDHHGKIIIDKNKGKVFHY